VTRRREPSRRRPRRDVCQTAPVPRLLPTGPRSGALLAVALLAGALGGCSSAGSGRTDAKYCAAVSRHLTELNSPSIATPSDVDKTVALYSSMAKVAPLAVEKEWDVLTVAYQTAATVVPGDQASMQQAVDTIRAAQQSATAAADYTRRLCNVQLGAPAVPTTAPAGSTTTAPASTVAPPG
jgi:hypothetical protein